MFQMMGVFAEFERALIAERVRAGLARARGRSESSLMTDRILGRLRINSGTAICNQQPDTLRLRLIDLRDFGRTKIL